MVIFLGFCISPALAQRQVESRPAPIDPVEGEKLARALLADLLAPKPAQTNTGVLKIRHAGSKPREIPVRFENLPSVASWTSVFETGGTNPVKLTVIHSDQQPDQYLLSGPGGIGSAAAAPRRLSGNQTMVPFADSDFWIADLGLEFFRWPGQRVVRKELKRGQACDVLQSTNPKPVAGGYARVVSWIDKDSGGIVYAEAYDSQNNRLKAFEPKKLEKVRGQYELESMEIHNPQSGSRTLIQFDLSER